MVCRSTSIVTLSLVLVAAGASAAEPLGACTLVVAGTGTKAGSEKVTQFWEDVNVKIGESLVQQLTAGSVAARLEPIAHDAAPDKVPGLIALALARQRCSRLLQLTHELGGGSGPDAYFAFEPAVFPVEEVNGGFKVGKEAFRKKYRFPLNSETLKTLKVSEIAGNIKHDLSTAGLLKQAAEK